MIQTRDLTAAMFGVLIGFALAALSKGNNSAAGVSVLVAAVFAYSWWFDAKKAKTTDVETVTR